MAPTPGRSGVDDMSVFNYLKADELPSRYHAHFHSLVQTVNQLNNAFGFQDANVKNQVEHVVMLLANFQREGNENRSAMDVLHSRVFSNYEKWCEYLAVQPQSAVYVHAQFKGSTGASQPGALSSDQFVGGKKADVLLWFLIWGEASNLRHMPECLCFIYHKAMEAWLSRIRSSQEPAFVPAGYFLEHTITPVYDVVAKAGKIRKDHPEKRNYDDFNEFFWTAACLECSYTDLPEGGLEEKFEKSEAHADGDPPFVGERLPEAPKTYLEKRSWFHVFLSFQRIYEWHAVTFQLLACLAFGQHLVWDTAVLVQVCSSVFFTLNLLKIVWTLLAAWLSFPTVKLGSPQMSGIVLGLAARYLILVYQTMYFTWALDHLKRSPQVGLRNEGSDEFWWWQYLWLSLLSLVSYFLEGLLQLWPSWSSWFLESRSDWWTAFLHIVLPISRIFVGKHVHEPMRKAIYYQIYWLTLIAFKLSFGYRFLVAPLCTPTLALYDDYVNFPNTSYYLTAFLVAIRWLPAFLVFCIDSSIWYSLWSGVVGVFVGLDVKLGVVKNFQEIREHFMDAPEAFCSKLISRKALPQVTEETQADAVLQRRLGMSQSSLPGPAERRGARALPNYRSTVSLESLSEQSSLLGSSANTGKTNSREHLRTYVDEFLDKHSIKGRQWMIFARVWNEVIGHLREGDLLSNDERDMLRFNSFNFLKKPVYLPVFVTAGLLETAAAVCVEATQLGSVEASRKIRAEIAQNVTMAEALGEAWELVEWLITRLLGSEHESDVSTVFTVLHQWMETDSLLFQRVSMSRVNSILLALTNLVKALRSRLPKKKDHSPPKAARLAKSTITAGAGAPAHAVARGVSGVVGGGEGLDGDVAPPGPQTTPSSSMKKSSSTSSLVSLAAMAQMSGGASATGVQKHSLPSTKYTRYADHQVAEELPDPDRDDVRDKLRSLFQTLKSMVKSTSEEASSQLLDALNFMSHMEVGFMWNSHYASERLRQLAHDDDFLKVVRKLYGLLAARPVETEPTNLEARRRLAFFTNSLFMDMPTAPPVAEMNSFTVVTPFYSEDVIYTRADLERENSDGITVLLYLQTLYKADWKNFLERLGIDVSQIWNKSYIMQTRLWASLRAQTLARTVMGMMMYEKAICLLMELERSTTGADATILQEKFNYVVAAQVYSRMRRLQDGKADDIEYLLHQFPNLRVAYIDEKKLAPSGQSAFFSCLVKSNSAVQGGLETVYRVRLPGNPVLGEGKPENQNHAMIFTRGAYVQAIDMNQDGFFEEALKHRNLLEEFTVAREEDRRKGCLPLTIVGFREHIFTGSVSSLANYMALQEASFVTTGQRVLTRPLCIRLHYGHPDLFDKLFFIQRGGISKASKGINLSEDVFAGYSNTIRGGRVGFKEYAQVGKGRDVGLQQIYKFEAKLSQGAAEQSLSRDVDRMANRLDFCRLLSFFFGGIGHYINSCLTVFTIITVAYILAFMALFDYERVGDRQIVVLGTVQIALAGMGVLQTLPLLATLTVEKGMFRALGDLVQVFGSGGPFYFIFHIQTRAYYYFQTLIAGGAQYRATGRGFVTRHAQFDENWRFFASSHIYLGAELTATLVIYGLFTQSGQVWGHIWSMLVAALSFMWVPYWFNPLAFNWVAVMDDYKTWLLWITSKGGSPTHSWDTWWREEKSYLWQRLRAPEKATVLFRAAVYVVMAAGVVSTQSLNRHRTLSFLRMVAVCGGLLLAVLYVDWVVGCQPLRLRCEPRPNTFSRFIKIPLAIAFIVVVVQQFIEHPHFIHLVIALYYAMSAVYMFGVVSGITAVSHLLRIHDFLIGHFMFLPLFLLAALQIPDKIQTWLLYHNALSEGVLVETILKQARKSQQAQQNENEDSERPTKELQDLRTQLEASMQRIEAQERVIQDLVGKEKS